MAINKQKKVFVGLSGGVDSSLAAALLLEKGYQVVGVYMKNWTENIGNMCCSTDQDAMDARLVAKKLGIPFYVWNFEKEYKEKVMGYFFSEYENGRTPNPDVLCNREIKFKMFLDRALALGADFVATGHYARIKEDKGQFHLLKGLDKNKDQSYFLCALTQNELAKIIFPVGDYTKPEVRQLAEKYNLHTATKKDSQGICFVGEINIKDFLKNNIKVVPGKVIDTEGNLLGYHEGLAFYTIGQREGLPMLSNGPWYVVDKNLHNNDLIVSRNANDPLLWRTECLVDNVSWTNKEYEFSLDLEVSVRYRHEPASATIVKDDQNKLRIIFDNPERAITPGQFAVFYLDEELIGSGTIIEVF